MSKVNFDNMTDAELRHYFLRNRQDHEAFEVYMERFRQRPKKEIARPDDPDFDAKIEAAIRQKIAASNPSS